MTKARPALRLSAAVGAIGIALFSASSAMAQDAPDPAAPAAEADDRDGDIVVTGTRIRSAGLASTSPINTVDAEQIQLLRAVTIDLFGLDAKFWGVVVMGAAIAILFVLPWLDKSPVRSMRYKGWLSRIALAIFVVSFVILGYLGLVPATEGRTMVAQILTVLYFLYFILMPFYTRMEKTKPVPERVTG